MLSDSKSLFSSILLLITISYISLNNGAYGYSSGAPIEAFPEVCATMTPRHPYPPETTPTPFKILLDNKNITQGGIVRVTLQASAVNKIMGFLAIGRTSQFPTDTVAYGEFLDLGDTNVQYKSCSGLPSTVATHRAGDAKEQVVLYWKAPAMSGDYLLSVTFVENYYVIWAAEKSEIITVN